MGITMFVVLVAVFIALFDHSPVRGYYRYNGRDYYYQKSHWYEYDAYNDDWYEYDDSDILDELITDDTFSEYKIDDHDGRSFEDTSWYIDDSSSSSSDDSWSSSDWDSGSSWDSSDSWDSGSTDWDSDW